jgi:hypothetical protein
MIPKTPLETAKRCRHYAMCKIDFLGTGLCPPGKENHFVSYYPQGRMDIYAALVEDRIPVTERLLDIADSCTLCGFCDKQCYFVTELRPLQVMEALKERVASHVEKNALVVIPEKDHILEEFQGSVGKEWASNDPAILISYAHDPGPFTGLQLPKYVVLPKSTEEVSQIVKLCAKHDIPYALRGNGSSVMGLVFSPEGLVLDLHRMQEIHVNTDNWMASVGPGVSAFDLQKRASEYDLRASVAEPAALVCANLMCSGIFSTFSNAYGTAADNYVDAEFVNPNGEVFTMGQRQAPNLFAFQPLELPAPGICTRVDIRLHPKTEDEEGLLIPCQDFQEAAQLARDLSQRRIGLALAVLGLEYISTFMSPTLDTARRIKRVLKQNLGLEYAVLMIGDRFAVQTVRSMGVPVIDQEMLRLLTLGLPRLIKGDWLDLVAEGEGPLRPYEILFQPEMMPMLEAVLKPSPEALAEIVAPDLRDFYGELYSRPEMTDMVWLNDFRIISSRMGREKHVVAFIVYVPLDKIAIIEQINEDFRRIADGRSLKNDYGFLTPLDLGKRAVLEYDYYMDQTDENEIERMRQAVMEAGQMLERATEEIPGVRWIKYVFNQGFSRKESFLYT